MELAYNSSGNHKNNRSHIVLIRGKLAKKREDKYLANMALAMLSSGFSVTILTSTSNKKDYNDGNEFPDNISVLQVAWWIPNSICGFLKPLMNSLKTTWMAFTLLSYPPKPKPCLFVVDNSLLLCILKSLGRHKVFYLEHFKYFKHGNDSTDNPTASPTLFAAKWMKYADEIIVENECLAELFRKLYPLVTKNPKVLTPCVDGGLWNEPIIHIERIIPDLRKEDMLFLSVGKYRKSTNFILAIEAFELLINSMRENCNKEKLHLVIAGQCKSLEEMIFYNDLVEDTKQKLCASHVTFLRQLPTIHHKTLLSESNIVIHPGRDITLSDYILAAMSIGKPIIAANRGVAPKLLEHRVSGILIDPDPRLFALTLQKLIVSPSLRMFLGEMSKKAFDAKFSFKCFTRKTDNLLRKYVVDHEHIIDLIKAESEKFD